MTKPSNPWKNFKKDHPCPWCWACGRDEHDRPAWWHAPFRIDRAHIVNKPRLQRRECAVLLCSLCHRLSHGDKFPECDLPTLERGHLIWLKRVFDPDWFDLELLGRCCVGELPKELVMPEIYLVENEPR